MEKVRTCVTNISLNEKTYRNVTFQPTLVNFFYGGNGAGKSTLARAIKTRTGLTWDTPSSEDLPLMVFNEDYIKDNIQSYGNIPGVFTMTEEDADVRKDLDAAIAQRNETEGILKKAQEEASVIINLELAIKKQYREKVWNKTVQWMKTDFPKAISGFSNSKERFFNELYSRPRVQGDFDTLRSNYIAVFDTVSVNYHPYEIIPNSLPSTDLLAKPIISGSDTDFARFVRALGNLDWVRHGHDKYMTGDRCPFCQGSINKKDFEEGLASCFDEQYRADMQALEKFVPSYKNALNQIYIILKRNQSNPFQVEEGLSKSYQYEFDFFMERARANVDLLDQKLREPSAEIINFEDLTPYLKKLSDCINLINQSIAEYMTMVNDPKKKEKAAAEIWSFMAYECRGLFEDYDRDQKALIEKKEKNGKELQDAKTKLGALKEEIKRLNTYTANTTEVMEQINTTLVGIGFKGFKLREKPGASYVYQLVRDGMEDEPAKDLSEGERNFIAFLYFYHTVTGSQNKDGKPVNKIVVIDDPVSSMDHNTLFYVCTLTRNLIDICCNNFSLEGGEDMYIKQFFCLTHNPVFFRDITYNRISDYECVTFFEITKDEANHTHVDERFDEYNNMGTIIRANRSPVRNYYDSLWHIVRTTKSKEALMTAARQILDYHFLQNDGYNSTKFRELLFKGKNKDAFTKENPIYYNIADSMVAFLSVGASNFNDGLFFDTAPYTIEQMKAAFQIIFDVMGRSYHYKAKMGQAN